MSKTSEIATLLGGSRVPGLPQVAIRLLELSQDPENGPAEFADVIELDPGLTGQILRFINSSYFGFSREIGSVRLAITLVGIRTIKNFALWSAVYSVMPRAQSAEFSLNRLWQDSLRRGLFARVLARRMGRSSSEAEELFVGALLQDMAIPLLLDRLSTVYENLLRQRREEEFTRLSELERKEFGWTHAEAGAVLAENWRFPPELVELIRRHASLSDSSGRGIGNPQSSGPEIGCSIVCLSALLPASSDPHWNEQTAFCSVFQRFLPGDSNGIQEVFAETDEAFREVAPVFNLSDSGDTLSQRLEQELLRQD